MSREWTSDEIRDQFLTKIWKMISYWKTVPTDQDRMDGIVFSILAMIDGDDPELPSFLVIPSPHGDDKEYARAKGENWYPQSPRALSRRWSQTGDDKVTHFHIEVDLICPSNWKEEDVRKWVSRSLTGDAELGALRISQLDGIKRPEPDYVSQILLTCEFDQLKADVNKRVELMEEAVRFLAKMSVPNGGLDVMVDSIMSRSKVGK